MGFEHFIGKISKFPTRIFSFTVIRRIERPQCTMEGNIHPESNIFCPPENDAFWRDICFYALWAFYLTNRSETADSSWKLTNLSDQMLKTYVTFFKPKMFIHEQ